MHGVAVLDLTALRKGLQVQSLGTMPWEPMSTPKAARRRAAKRRRALCGSGSEGGSDWEPGAPAPHAKRVHAGRQAGRAPPAVQVAEAVAGAVLRNRIVQRQYLSRKKVSVYTSQTHLRLLWL